MKNTMKLKSLLSFFVPAAILSLSVASCSDYDNGYTENAIKFAEEFRKAYGDIDPQQDWNLAERGTVTVSTLKESEVKIYALRGDEYVIVGDYEGVINTQVLGFDMVEGTTTIMVSDGQTAIKTIPGGVVSFDGSTRTVNEGETYYGGVRVKIEKITNETGLTLDENGVTYPKYKEATQSDYEAMKAVIPEIGWRSNYTNLNKVTHDFSYVSNGTFIVYPYYWETSSNNTIGIYYNDANGNRQEVDLYTIKAGDEFQYAGSIQRSEKATTIGDGTYEANSVATLYWYDHYRGFTWSQTWSNVVGGNGSNLFGFSADEIKNADKLVMEGINYYGDTQQFRILFFNNSNNSDVYPVYVDKSAVQNGRYEVSLSHIPTEIRNNCTVCLAGAVDAPDNRVNPENTFKDSGNLHDVYGEVQFSSIKLVTESAEHGWQNYSQNFCSEIFTKNIGTRVRGQGIKVEIPKGTVFGMYLKKTDGSGSYTFYSQDDLNNPGVVGCGVTDNGNGTVTDVDGQRPCYASTFHVGEQMFLGFEDWPNVFHESDFDLNDVVFAFDGCKPTIINEDPTPGGTWLLVCEDLGGSFDTDYNDVIFKVEHLSGKEYATVTAMAAGGTLASYIFFRDPTVSNAPDQCLGEIHQLFNVAPEASGAYTPINVGYAGGTNRAEKNGNTVTIQVSKNWTMAYYQADQFHQGSEGNYGNEDTNMGGFQIRTLKIGTEAPTTAQITEGGIFTTSATNSIIAAAGNVIPAPEKGAPPYILCLPYTYQVDNSPVTGKRSTHVWSWPLELNTICSAVYDNSGKYHGSTGGAYTGFGAWVSDANKQENKYWYKTVSNDNMIVDPLILATEDMQQGGNGGNGGNEGGLKPNPLSNKGPMTLILGRGISLEGNLVGTDSGSDIVWTFTHNGTTYNMSDLRANGVEGANPSYFVPNSAGLHVITAYQAENDTYEAGSTTFNLMVYQAQQLTIDINGTKHYLAYDYNGSRLILSSSDNNQTCKWVLMPSGIDDYYYLYNVGAKKYLSIYNGYNDDLKKSYYALWVDSPKGDQMARFSLKDDGRIERYNHCDRYLGYYSDNGTYVVDANANASGGSTAIYFTKTNVNADN